MFVFRFIQCNVITFFMMEVPIIRRANQWTGFYMTETSIMIELMLQYFVTVLGIGLKELSGLLSVDENVDKNL